MERLFCGSQALSGVNPSKLGSPQNNSLLALVWGLVISRTPWSKGVKLHIVLEMLFNL
jgi:hypothetical protein